MGAEKLPVAFGKQEVEVKKKSKVSSGKTPRATKPKKSAVLVFDQRDQQVSQQYNVDGNMYVATIQSGTHGDRGALETREQTSEILEIVKRIDERNISDYPAVLVDKKIEEDIATLRASRFFSEYDRAHASLALADRLMRGEYSDGDKAARSKGLAWCARILSSADELAKAEKYLEFARGLEAGHEIEIANAFICSQKGDEKAALDALANLDTQMARSAALMIVAHHRHQEGAINWLRATGINAKDLDPDGKYYLLRLLLELARWQEALDCLDAIDSEDLHEAPILHHFKAITQLISAVPSELRTVVLNQVPFDAATFPLASDTAAIEARRAAYHYFGKAVEVAQRLGLPDIAAIDDEYKLWLELRDPDETAKSREKLKARLRNPESALRLVYLGLQFGIALDLGAVEREIERQIALHGGTTRDTAVARFALAHTHKKPEEAASYINKHREELAGILDRRIMLLFQGEMYVRARLLERAKECLEILGSEGLPETDQSRLRARIAEAEGADPIETRKAQFVQTDSLSDLLALVDVLEAGSDWDGLCEYSQILFERTRSRDDAERLAYSLSKTKENERLIEFLEANRTFLVQSKNLQFLYCWALYNGGKLLDARSELLRLVGYRDDSNYRTLQIKIDIALGDWGSLSAFVANEWLQREKRNAQELVSDAQLALQLGSPNARELLFAAVEKGKDDADILSAAYFLASSAGWEEDIDIFKWLSRAAELSGDDGPIQKLTLKEILDRKPEWDRRESETWELLGRGDIPMFVAARSLNRSLIHLMLFPALANLAENDPRRRGSVAAYSGKRLPTTLHIRGAIGLDATALLTLSFLGLLDKAVDAFDTVYVPHSTLLWLFEEKQKATFHQPSRIEEAHRLQNLITTGALDRLVPSTVADSDLAAQVGDVLALLIAESEKVRDEPESQCLVVRPSPVHQLTSLLDEEADLSSHAAVLTSCKSIVGKLWQKGKITAEEERKASAYLQLQEKPWPGQPEIDDGATLYLDDLAISHFLHLGILGKLRDAGFKPIVSRRKVSEMNEFISYESISSKVNEAIESIRSTINSRIESGKVRLGKRHISDELESESLINHPTVGVIGLAKDCETIITDDRFLNQHSRIDEGSAQAAIFTTLDLIDALASSGSITPEERLEYRTRLQRAGYLFIAIGDDELACHLNASQVKNDKVIETAELKAIRENFLRARMSTWLHLPKEAPWLELILMVFIRVMKGLWAAGADLSSVRARSDWIIEQVDIRGWAHGLSDQNGDNLIKLGRGPYILAVIIPPIEALRDIREAYWSWAEDRILGPIKNEYPELYSWLVDWYRRTIAESAERNLPMENRRDE